MDILTSRIILRPKDPQKSQRFYRDTLGLAVYRQFGPPEATSLVFFCGNGLLEVAGHPNTNQHHISGAMVLWFQVRDVTGEYTRLKNLGVTTLREPKTEAWGLIEAWIADPDGVEIVLVQIPADHPLRRDQRPIETLQEP